MIIAFPDVVGLKRALGQVAPLHRLDLGASPHGYTVTAVFRPNGVPLGHRDVIEETVSRWVEDQGSGLLALDWEEARVDGRWTLLLNCQVVTSGRRTGCLVPARLARSPPMPTPA